MSKEQLKHIFEPTACLSQRQIKGYVSGKMVHEEAHAAEAHLLSCPFCADAVEAMQADKAALAGMEKLDSSFIAQHFGVPAQEVKATVKAPPVRKAGAYSTHPDKEGKEKTNIPWKPLSAAAGLVAVVCIAWFMRDSIFPGGDNTEIAQQVPLQESPPEQPVIAYTPEEDNTTPTEAATDTNTLNVAEPLVQEDVTPATIAAAEPKTPAEKAVAKKEAEKKLAIETAKRDAGKDKVASAPTNVGSDKAGNKKLTQSTAAEKTQRARLGNSYSADADIQKIDATEVKTRTEEKEEEEAKEPPKVNTESVARTGVEKADDLYNKGRYKRALKVYQDEMYDSRSNRRDAATYMAAQCHIELGERMQAKTLLSSLVEKNSVKKQQAQQMLNQLGE